ncbi:MULTISPECIES: GNAT family N-acetyltransferase [unclassified Pseudoxanthomonas]|uniref:GNAT family N-acetyltransferase n=1 Tax=unclassified Pseudoxanthomonas TaxID=2645906 RepID=UPI003076DEF5
MNTTTIRDAVDTDHAAILALNLESEHLLSPMDAERLRQLDTQAAYHRIAVDDDGVGAFLLVFRESADYDSPNYRWFSERYDRFLYIDRIAVSATRQGRGYGAALYDDLFAFARAAGIAKVVCEFYSEPLNEVSQRFHARYGFREVGREWLANGKQVSLQIAEL